MQTRTGTAWSELGLTYAAPRYPLRVETHLLRLVSRLLPGIITTTTQARMYALHAVAWAEVKARDYDLDAALDLVRRCEVVVAAATMAHGTHLTRIPLPHGYATVGPYIDNDQPIPIGKVSQPGAYTQYQWGFAGTYQGSEVLLGILEDGRPPGPGHHADNAALREGFAGLFQLADAEILSIDDVRAASHLCMCSAPENADGPWLRKVLFEGASEWTDVDESRRASARLLLRVVRDLGQSDDVPRDFRHAIGFGAQPAADGLERT